MPDNLYLVTGSDETAIAEAAAEIVESAAGKDADAFALDVIREGDEMSAVDAVNQTVNAVRSPPFFGHRKTVWLKQFSGFEKEGAKGSKGALPEALSRLVEVVKQGIPDDIVLVLSGTGVDRRRRLYKACRDAGEVVVCEKPDIRDRDWQDKVRALIEKRAGEAGVTLPRDAVDYLVEAFGTDTALIHCELEKLATYAGGTGQAVTLEEVQLLCHGEGEAISWSLRDAVGERDIARVLDIVDTLLRGERDTEGAIIGLVLQVANHVRNLLQARVMMQELKCRDERQFQAILDTFDKGQQASYRERGLEVATYHPYRARMIAKQALNYSGSELVAAVPLFRDAYYECVSSSIANRIVLERTLMALCAK